MARALMAMMLAVSFSGCAQDKQGRFNDEFDRYVGLPIFELTLHLGEPTRRFPTQDGRMAFMWDYLDRGRDCLVVVFATTASADPTLADWIIQSWRFAGNGCT